MGYLGIYTRNETVRCWVDFVHISDGSPVIPTTPTISIIENNVEIVSAALSQFGATNRFYYDYTVPTNPDEGTVEVQYSGVIDGVTCVGQDIFKIDLTKTHVLENRLGNQRITFFEATVDVPSRNVQAGVLNYQIIETKYDDDVDWTTPRSSHTLYFHYDVLGEINPTKVGEA